MSAKRRHVASRDKPTAAASDQPLTKEELEDLFDQVVREVEAERAAGLNSSSELPAGLLSELKPHLDALRRIFGKINAEKHEK